jgi:alpha-tubulin suppressor-like RCC1 family protein
VFLLSACGGDSSGPSGGQPAVALVVVSPGTATLIVGTTEQLSVTITDVNAKPLTGRPLVWRSSDNSRATVTQTGMVTAHAVGPVTVTATSEGKVGTASLSINPVPIATVSVVPANAALGLGTSSQLTAVPKDSNGTALAGRTVTWSTDNAGSVTVSPAGLISAVGLGSATITATSEGKSGTSTITVNLIPVASVSVTPGTANVAVAATTPLTATARDGNNNVLPGRVMSWSSSDSSKATVSPTGVVTGVKKGSVTITATSEGHSGSATITVVPGAPAVVTVSPNPLSITTGSTAQLSATVQDASGDTLTAAVTWNSLNPSIATVNGSGLVTGVTQGTAIITATSGGIVGRDTVNVGPAPVASVTLSAQGTHVGVGATIQYSATPRDAQGNPLTRPITWGTSDSAVATVNANGLVTGISAGTVLIVATSDGVSGSDTLTVVFEAVATVGVDPSSAAVGAGLAVQLSAHVIGTSGDTLINRVVTWSSSAPSIASVDSNGLVTGHVAGSATITATSENVDGTATVSVQVNLAFPALDGGYSHTCSLTASGATYCWGLNTDGQLGSGVISQSSAVPILVTGGVTFASLFPAGLHTCALTPAGAAWCWGSNSKGQLGTGDTVTSAMPMLVSGGLTFVQLTGGFSHACGLTTGGAAYCWGSNTFGELGVGNTTNRTIPTLVSGGHQFVALSARGAHSCGIDTVGETWCWGKNANGDLGDGTHTNRTVPVKVLGGLTFSSITTGAGHTCALTAAGAAWCWGDNGLGEVGDGTTTDRLVPTLVNGGIVFAQLKARGSHTCGIESNGTAWCWGENNGGQLGDASTVNRTAPVLVLGGHSFTDISSGADFSCGVTNSTTLYCWGRNSSGQLGNGSFADSGVPVKVLGQP